MPEKHISYLSQLRFDPKLWQHWWAKYITQIRLVIMLLLTIIAVGIYGYANIPRRVNPEINLAFVTVNTVLPGASPEDVEQLLTIPLEDEINNVDGIDTLTSTSVEGASNIAIQFQSGINADKAKEDVQSAVDSVKSTLPEDAKAPTVTKLDFQDEPVWVFSITSNKDKASLMRFTDLLEDRINDAPKIDRVVTSGFDEQDVEVILDINKVNSLGINPLALSQAVQKAANSYPSGSTETESSSFTLSIDRDITTVEDIRNVRVTISGQNIRLGDVANVSYISKNNQNEAYFASKTTPATPTIQFFVYKASNANIDAAEKEAQQVVSDTLKQYHNGYQLKTILNSAQEITDQFNDLTREFGNTILLVFLLLLVFLGLRQALISSLTVPLTFLATFGIIYAMGMTLNFLTMFSFLIALGVLIDDAIVVVAAMTRYYATGKFTTAQTGVLVWKDFIVPLVSTAITTIWAFVPMLLSTGIIGEFIKSIPIVVSITMISSTIIAIFITLPLMVVFLKPQFPRRVVIMFRVMGIVAILSIAILFPKSPVLPLIIIVYLAMLFIGYRERTILQKHARSYVRNTPYINAVPAFIKRIADKGLVDIEVLARAYMRVIDKVLVSKHGKRNTLIAIGVFTLVGYLLFPLGLIKSEFFPKQDAQLLYISVELPAGTNLTTNKAEMLSLLDTARHTEEVTYIVGETGQGFSGGFGGRSGQSNAFLLTLHLTDPDDRRPESSEIAQGLRTQYKNYTKGKLTVQELSGGPPAGADVQITLLGDDLTILDSYANIVMQFLTKQPGITNIDKSIKPGTSKLVFVPDQDKLSENNLTVDQVALWLRSYASGLTLDTVRIGKDEQNIVFHMGKGTPTPKDLGLLAIPTQNNGSVPLTSLGTIKLVNNPTAITREKGKHTITVSAAVVAGHNVADKNAALGKFVDQDLHLPEGYTTQTGGVNEENQKSVTSIIQAMALSFLLILVTMVIEFQSFRQTFIALLFIPLSIAGVFYIFALTQTPLSFAALIGILALFGIVVRHAIVVIEKINDDLKEGMTLRHALVDAAGNRLEPVLLTSLAAVVGLIPITISDPFWRGLGGAIIAGLLFSGAIKLFFVPISYYLMYGGDKYKKRA